MLTYAYDKDSNTLNIIAGTPRAKLNATTSKAEASLSNEVSSIEAGTEAT